MEGTTIHWHGMVQPGTPYMDGVDMVAQCSTPPGFEFQYTFTATPSGTHWYHSHTGVQYGNGLRGVMVVHERGGDWCAPGTGCPEDAQYTNDLPPILLTDYEPISSLDALLQLMNDKMKGAGAGLTPEGEDVDYSDTPWCVAESPHRRSHRHAWTHAPIRCPRPPGTVLKKAPDCRPPGTALWPISTASTTRARSNCSTGAATASGSSTAAPRGT